MFTGCRTGKIYRLPDNISELKTGTYINPDDKEDSYLTIIYNGREYAAYGVQGKTIKDSMIDKCIGYIDGDTNSRVYSLVDTKDYIADYYVNGVMEQVGFLRAIDTIGKSVDTPDYIDDLEYDIWK